LTPRHLDTSKPLQLHTIPPDDERVYDMICRADTIGVFQIESRAQMSMLPRLKPRNFYDLVIEVAIVRPGPIQGDMVHPYLRRRDGEEPVNYVAPSVEKVLKKTLGVPLFQEQCMALAVEAAGFTPGEADQLRRAMAAWKRKGDQIVRFGAKLIEGMVKNKIPREFAERCFEQIKGFSEYGFPESHAASFALLVYASSWLKCHHPAAFAAALINSQPMGFYQPAQIVRDAQDHGVEVRPIDVNRSGWDCTLEEGVEVSRCQGVKADSSACPPLGTSKPRHLDTSSPALRLGLRLVRGLSEADANAIAEAVSGRGPFPTIEALRRASGVRAVALKRLAAADAFGSMGLDRQGALWQVRALRDAPMPLFDATLGENTSEPVVLPSVAPMHAVAHDYAALGLSLKAHPVSFLREELDGLGVTTAADLRDQTRCPAGRSVQLAGLVLLRQRPGTAKGIVFITIEDETGAANLIVREKVYKKYRKALRASVAVMVRGRVERRGLVVHLLVGSARSLDGDWQRLAITSRDFH
jgi:error-prone DNA polymerase